MVARLKGPIFGPYHCSNCMIQQPYPLKTNCVFCGDYFSNIEAIMVYEAMKKNELEGEMKNEDNIYRRDRSKESLA